MESSQQMQTKRMFLFGMQIQCFFTKLLLLLFFICLHVETFAQNINVDTLKNQLNFNNDNGFITKEEGLAFLIANSLIDTNKNKRWNEISKSDTIGRYFRIENSDNYLICLPYSLDFFKPKFLIIKISFNGKLLKSEKYDFGNAHKWNSYYKDFFKYGNFFGIVAQGGHGCGKYHYSNLYLFKELLPQDSISFIRLVEVRVLNKNIIKSFWSSIEMENDDLIVHYKFINGNVKFGKEEGSIFKFRRLAKKKFTIKFIYKNRKWISDDTKHLKKIEQFRMKHQFFM